ncbi:hypothetical protein [Formosa sp. PL04]|uniref:hypothetical protein n=1 Tax=Formosa sp. PL04 TaxID=3081755 RepID=UPI0029813448|nr:hypothetical protein [Formosa sp. PL04]MDW5289067.1 hypothetical protein [Formosa sp. PL04]
MNTNIKSILKLTFASALALSIFSCSDSNDDNIAPPDPSAERPYHLVLGVGSTDDSTTYSQGVTITQMQDPNTTFSYNNYGFEVPSTRTARLYTSDDGLTLYNLNYGGGDIAKYNYISGQNYSLISNTDVQAVMGTAYPRWTKINEDYASIQNVVTENVYDDPNAESPVYLRTKSTVTLALINLNTMIVETNNTFEFPWNEAEASQGINVFRIDAPVLSNGKLYYGAAKRHYNALTGENDTMVYEDAETLVVDYSTLGNPTTLRTDIDGVAGSTNGYRTPVAHTDEKGDIYQLVTSGDATILRLDNGEYDESYGAFNIKDALGHAAEANTGWFYVGNGIGYVPVLNTDEGDSASSYWYVVRVDVYNKTAVKMNISESLWLRQYQWASVIEGELYMALTPLGGTGNIYIFDPTDASANGFTKGATLQTGNDAFYIGLF